MPVKCPLCGTAINPGASVCTGCHATEVRNDDKLKWMFIYAPALAGLATMLGTGKGGSGLVMMGGLALAAGTFWLGLRMPWRIWVKRVG